MNRSTTRRSLISDFVVVGGLVAVYATLQVIERQLPLLGREPGEPPDPAERARRVGDASGIMVAYGDPLTFFVPPYLPKDAKVPQVEMRAAAPSAVWFALDGIEPSLAQYPPGFVAGLIRAIFICGEMWIEGERAGGTYGPAWLLLSAPLDIGRARITLTNRRLVHHELSSLVYYRGGNAQIWQETIPSDWAFRESAAAQLRDRGSPPPVETGFLNAYGATSTENDFNIYAEKMMTEMNTVMQLAQRVPVIARKAALLRQIYVAIDPRMDDVFSALGMTGLK
jgi:hypothetical protein